MRFLLLALFFVLAACARPAPAPASSIARARLRAGTSGDYPPLSVWTNVDEEERGTLGALRSRWLGQGAGPRAALPVSALLAATAERLALIPFVAAAKRRVGRPVEDAAQEARVVAASANAVATAATTRGSVPPRRDVVEAFFRAQIDAAKTVQRRAPASPSARAFSLEDDLRPAIARISARMAMLLVRVPRGTERAVVVTEARTELAHSGLDAEQVERLAASIAAFGDEGTASSLR